MPTLAAHVAAQIQGEREQSDLFFEALRRLLPAPSRSLPFSASPRRQAARREAGLDLLRQCIGQHLELALPPAHRRSA